MPVYAEASNNPSGAGSAVKYNRLEPMSVASGEDENMVDGHEPGGRLSQGPGSPGPMAREPSIQDEYGDDYERAYSSISYDPGHPSGAHNGFRDSDDLLVDDVISATTKWTRGEHSIGGTSDDLFPIKKEDPAHGPMKKFESLDYEQSVNVPFLRAQCYAYLPKGGRGSDLTNSDGPLSEAEVEADGYYKGTQETRELGDHSDSLDDEDNPLLGEGRWLQRCLQGRCRRQATDFARQQEEQRNIYGYTGKTLTRWILTWLVGICTGLTAWAMGEGIMYITEVRWEFLLPSGDRSLVNEEPDFAGMLIIVCFNLALVLLASGLTLWWAPPAAGSGIPEVKAYLNGVRIKDFFRLSTYIVKVVGTILGVASGLMIGPEGPMVHIGALIGSGFTSGRKIVICCGKRFTFQSRWLMRFRSDHDRRDFISIGAASGFAAAFGAPVGSILFALEETCSFWNPALMWRTMTATLLSVFTLLMLQTASSTEITTTDAFNKYGLLSLDASIDDATIAEVPLYLILGCLGGLFGALFNSVWRKKMERIAPFSPIQRYQLILFVSVFTSILLYGVAWAGTGMGFACQPDNDVEDDESDDVFRPENLLRFGCPKQEVNVLASLFFGERETGIKMLLEHADKFHGVNLLIMFFIFFFLMIVTFSLALPTGLFMPTILIGAVGGALFGKMMAWLNYAGLNERRMENMENHMALIGAVALLGGIQRSTVSLCVIITEGTGQSQLLLPIILTTVMARYVGNHFNHGLYEIALHLKHIPFLENQVHHNYYMMRVSDVMQTKVRSLQVVDSVRNIRDALENTKHNGFPVVTKEGKLCGMILRSQLRMILRERLFLSEQRSGNDRIRRPSIDEALQVPLHAGMDDTGKRDPDLDYGDLDDQLDRTVNIMRIMNQGPHVVQDACPLSRAYTLFITVGLRHLVVIDADGHVVGLITRKDLCSLDEYKPMLDKRRETTRVSETLIPSHASREASQESAFGHSNKSRGTNGSGPADDADETGAGSDPHMPSQMPQKKQIEKYYL